MTADPPHPPTVAPVVQLAGFLCGTLASVIYIFFNKTFSSLKIFLIFFFFPLHLFAFPGLHPLICFLILFNYFPLAL